LSQLLNSVFVRILSAPVRDISSGFRLYRHDVLKDIKIDGTNFEALEELLIKVHMNGWRIKEVPFHYAPRKEGKSKARMITFGICLLKTLKSMWALRSSIASADYDERAFDSVIPLQRYWQRTRHKVILEWAKKCQGVILDVGCGSSRIIQDIPQIVGVDVALYKLRYMKQKCNSLVLGSIFDLPFADKTFDGIICSQVIEHIPSGDRPFRELARVIRPGGLLIIGTPDYGRPYWPIIERIYKWVHPNGYADEHITHYTLPTLSACLQRVGFEVLEHHYILGAELNVLARKINGEMQS
jgi:SAM-dependent methyltransferase